MKNSLEKWITVFLLSSSIFISVLLAEATVLALMSQFKAIYIYFSLIPAFIIAMLFVIPLKKDVRSIPNVTLPLILILFLISLLLILFPHDTFGGRDESIYSNLASHLANTSSLNIPSYLNNLPDKLAENIRALPQGYPIWLGIQEILFGKMWILRSNIIVIILGLSSFFLVSSYLVGNKLGLIVAILFSSSMPFLWFSRETMSENLSFFLLWSIILYLLLCLKTKKYIYFIPVFVCSWLFALTRFEGFILQFIVTFGLPPLLISTKVGTKKILVIFIISMFVLMTNIYIANDIFLPSFFKTDVPQVSESIKRDVSSVITSQVITDIIYPTSKLMRDNLSNKYPYFIYQMIAKYNLIFVILSIFLVSTQFLIRFKRLDNSKKIFFVILILLIPEYYKLISPNVTLDQPWLYRRYMYALLPYGYLSVLIFFDNFKNRKLIIILAFCLFIINLALSSRILFLRNNWPLIGKLNEITKDLVQNDLVIINERPLGYYSPESFLVINKGVRTAASSVLWTRDFTPENKIFAGEVYNKIYLLSAKGQAVHSLFNVVSHKSLDIPGYSSFEIVSRKSLDVEYTQLIPSCQLSLLGTEIGVRNVYDIGSLPFPNVEKYCNQPKNEIVKRKDKLYLYELTYKAE